MKNAEEAYERTLARLRVLEQSVGDIATAKQVAPVDGADTEARDGEDELSISNMAAAAAKSTGPIDGADTEARDGKDELSIGNMAAAAAKSTGPIHGADAEGTQARVSEDEQPISDTAAASAKSIAVDSADTIRAGEDERSVECADSEAKADEEEMKVLDDDEKIRFETGKRKRVDDGIRLVKRLQGQLTFKMEMNRETFY